MKVDALGLPGVLLVTADVHRDRRGALTEVWQAARYAELGLTLPFVQDNHAHSVRGVIRGLHWQLDRPQGKLVTVLQGCIWDVVVDVRPGPHRGRWVAAELAAGSGRQLWIPPGYAHGFVVCSDTADVLYKNTAPWLPGRGRGVRWDDPELALPWPVDVPVVSDADAALPWLADVAAGDLPAADGGGGA
ncbi:MAG: dTDP-4-dehydrorhamnose 3,5-epimerase [Alphaproteobacteria bacterium]|nr:dTDP-4-dehydrorhamnose 3,5-epimerase [Alphaproteobacteria bacterium]